MIVNVMDLREKPYRWKTVVAVVESATKNNQAGDSDEVEQAVKALTSVIEPIMMVGIAGMVGTILLSMYLPMFSIFDQLG